MSDLNLVPNIKTLLIQTGLFSVNIWAIKKLYIDPYSKLIKKRLTLTDGLQADVRRMQEDMEKMKKAISKEEKSAEEEIKYQTAETLRLAQEKSAEILAKTQLEIDQEKNKFDTELRKKIEQGREEAKKEATELTKLILKKILN